jgi:pheromone shutdown-related protein TraB
MKFGRDVDVVRLLLNDGRELIFVGTSHIDPVSVGLVHDVILEERPDVVALEWDQKRYDKAMDDDTWKNMDIIEIIKSKQLVVLGVNIFYKFVQNSLAKMKDTKSGLEFPEAVNCAREVGANIALVDRDIQVTFKRFWRKLGFWEKMRFPFAFWGTLSDLSEGEDFEDQMALVLENENMDYVFEVLKEKFPTVFNVILSERNEYISSKVNKISADKIVVVVGKAHLPGIVEEFDKQSFVDPAVLEAIPKKKLSSKVLGYAFPALIIVLLLLSFKNGATAGFEQLLRWFLFNGGLAALGILAVLGHPLTALTALVTAPIGTLSPVLSVGFFAAIVQGIVRKPKVSDFESMDKDISSVKGVFRNRVLHILVIFFASSFGGAIGNIIGGFDILKNLF